MPMPPSDWEIDATKRVARELAQRLRDDGYGDDYQLLIDSLEGETPVLDSLDRIVNARTEAKAFAESLGGMIADMQTRKARFEKLAEKLTAGAQEIIEAGGLAAPKRPLRRPAFTGSLAPAPRHVIPTMEAKDMDPRYQRVTIEPNKTELAKALDASEPDVPAVWSNLHYILRILTR